MTVTQLSIYLSVGEPDALLWVNCGHFCLLFWGFLDAKNHFWCVAKEDFIIVEIEIWKATPLCVRTDVWCTIW